MRNRHTTEDALTGLGIIVLILMIILLVYGTLVLVSPGQSGTQKGGMLRTFTSDSGYLMRHVGPVNVFTSVDGTSSGVAVRYLHPDPGRMGAAEMTVALFIGNMGVSILTKYASSGYLAGSLKRSRERIRGPWYARAGRLPASIICSP